MPLAPTISQPCDDNNDKVNPQYYYEKVNYKDNNSIETRNQREIINNKQIIEQNEKGMLDETQVVLK